MEHNTAAALRGHVDAFNARDLDVLMAGFTQDALWLTGSTIVRGHRELTEFFGAAMTGLLPTLTIKEMVAQGDRVACQLTETVTVASEERTFSIAGFYQLRGGLIASAKIYREGSAELG